MARAVRPFRARLLTLFAMVMVVLSGVLIVGGSPADAQVTASLTAVPSSLTVPIGSRACYVLKPSTRPTAPLSVTATPGSGLTNKATVTAQSLSGQGWTRGDANVRENLKTSVAFCVKGVAEGSGTITHSVSTTDTSYSGVTPPSVSVEVTTADTKPTVRFLFSEMLVLEGDTFIPGTSILLPNESIRGVRDLWRREVTIRLDIAPAPTSDGVISVYVPYPIGPNHKGLPHWGGATYDVDYAPQSIADLSVPYTSGSNDMEFTFRVISDNEDEGDEGLRMYLVAEYFDPSYGFRDNTDVAVGAPTSPTVAQRRMTFTIIDDDSGGAQCGWCATEGEIGVFHRSDYVDGDEDQEQESQPQRLQQQVQQEPPTPTPTPTSTPRRRNRKRSDPLRRWRRNWTT